MAYPGFFRRKVLEYKEKHNLTIQATADYPNPDLEKVNTEQSLII